MITSSYNTNLKTNSQEVGKVSSFVEEKQEIAHLQKNKVSEKF